MSLKYQLDSLEGLNAEVAKLYKADGDRFVLDVSGLPQDEPSDELKAALQEERKNVATLQKEIKGWKALGVDPDAAKKTISDLENELKEVKKGNRSQEDFDKMLEQAKAGFEAEKATLVKERDEARAGESKAVIDTGINSAFLEAGFGDTGMKLLPDRYKGRVRIDVGEDGTRSTVILTPEGDAPMVGSGKGNRATFADLAAEAAKDFENLLDSKRKGGAGAGQGKGQGQGQKSISRSDWEGMTPAEQSAAISDGATVTD